MSNKQRARVGYEPLRLRSTLSQGMAALPSFGDPVAQVVQSGFADIAQQFSQIGDQLAAEEGQRAALSDVTDLTWRPTRAPTVRGRAYDQAGLALFNDRLESQARTQLQGLADQHEGNPQGFAEAALNLRGELETTALFDEVRQPFDILFQDLTARHARVLDGQARQAAERAASANATQRIADLENIASQQMEAARQGVAGARDLVIGTEAQIERHYASMVADGLMSPEAGQRAVDARQRDVAVNYYLGTAQRAADAGNLDELRTTLARDYGAGQLDDLDADGWNQLQTGLDRLAREADAQAVFRSDVLTRQADSVAERVALGFGDEAAVDALRREAAAHPDAGEAQSRIVSQLELANQLHSLPVPEARALLRSMSEGAQNDRAQALVRQGETMLDTIEREARSNPLGLAERRHLIDPVESLFDERLDRSDTIRTRISQRDAASLGLGVPSVFFRDDEVDQIRALVSENPAEAAALAGDLVRALGPDAPAVLRELGGRAEPMLEAGLVLAAGSNNRAAADVLNGYARDANGSRLPSVPSDQRVAHVSSHVDAALIDTPADSQRIQATAHAIARSRAAQAGIDPGSDEIGPIYLEALNEAAGGQTVNGQRFGGFTSYDPTPMWGNDETRVLVPPTIRADMFADVLQAVRDADLAALSNPPMDSDGQVMRASVLHRARPVAVPGGYRFATGDPRSDDPAYIADGQGNAFVLPLDRLTPALRARVPEAFR